MPSDTHASGGSPTRRSLLEGLWFGGALLLVPP